MRRISRILPILTLGLGLAQVRAETSAPPPLNKIPSELQEAQIVEKLGQDLRLEDFNFTDEAGRKVPLSTYFHPGRPVILTLVYYGCPNLCGFFLNGLTESLKNLDWNPGRQFEVVTISIDPHEKPELALAKKENLFKVYERPEAKSGWHFLTGDETSIKRLASEVGFGYRYDKEQKQYAHSAAAIVLTPSGKVSRYLYGIEFPKKTLRLAILEASNGRVGNVIDRAVLFCFQYDPQSRGYSLALMRLMQAGSAGSILVFGAYLGIFWRRQRRSREEHQARS